MLNIIAYNASIAAIALLTLAGCLHALFAPLTVDELVQMGFTREEAAASINEINGKD